MCVSNIGFSINVYSVPILNSFFNMYVKIRTFFKLHRSASDPKDAGSFKKMTKAPFSAHLPTVVNGDILEFFMNIR